MDGIGLTINTRGMKNKSAPISYSLDFSVSDNGDTTVIEANDGWSLGSYGLDSETYSRFLIDRWLQIIR